MMAISSFMVPLGAPAPDFTLPAIDGRTITLAALSDSPALLVMFLCNHCPYVQHIESALGEMVSDYESRGLTAVGVCSNDTATHPDDAAPSLAAQADRAGFTFPYLVDESQQAARDYQAACTPDFFLYDAERTLAYHGQFDASRPGNDVPVTGESLRNALDLVLKGQPIPEPQPASLGCSIKWKPGMEPG